MLVSVGGGEINRLLVVFWWSCVRQAGVGKCDGVFQEMECFFNARAANKLDSERDRATPA